jgi:hypothetical protein
LLIEWKSDQGLVHNGWTVAYRTSEKTENRRGKENELILVIIFFQFHVHLHALPMVFVSKVTLVLVNVIVLLAGQVPIVPFVRKRVLS